MPWAADAPGLRSGNDTGPDTDCIAPLLLMGPWRIRSERSLETKYFCLHFKSRWRLSIPYLLWPNSG